MSTDTTPTVRSLLPVVMLVGIMWVVELVDAVLPGDLDGYGIESRDTDGLTGIVAAPFLHADFAHLMANTVPFLILGSIVALRNRSSTYPRRAEGAEGGWTASRGRCGFA